MIDASQEKHGRPGARRSARAALALATVLAWSAASADGVDGYVEWTGSKSKVSTEDASGTRDEQTASTFLQRYSVNFSRRFFPNLYYRMGGLYERQDTTTDLSGVSLDSTRKRLIPYFLLSLRTRLFLAEIGFDRQAERDTSGASVARLVRDTWRMNFRWNPEENLPRTRLELSHRNTYDYMRRGLDIVEDRAQLTAHYLGVKNVDLYYRGSLQRDTDRLNDGRVTTNFQTARVSYGTSWLDRRLVFSTDYTLNYRGTDTTRAGAGEVITPVVAAAGLSSIDDTPETDPLSPNPALIDTNRTSPAGVNLGLPGPGGDIRPRNFGVDLGFPQQVNTILVWIDRQLPPEIASAFSWRVYTSDDNLNWTLRQILASAPFGPFDQNFEVRFEPLTARYVKLVVSPLSSIVPDATSWPQIEVTELEPQVRRPSADLSTRTSTTSHLLNANFRARLLDRPALYYEGGYFLSARTDGPTLYTLSNGLSVSHALSPILTGAARLSREDRREIYGTQTAYLFSGSLTADPLATVHESVVVTHVDELGDFGKKTSSVIFTSSAQLYTGIGANLSLERSVLEPNIGGRTDAKAASLSATFTPHPKFTMNLLAQDRRTRTTYPEPSTLVYAGDTRALELGAAYRPYRALYLFASERLEQSAGAESRTLRNYALTWTPFPDGTFHFNVFYDSTYRTELQESQQTIVPSIRWDITPKIYVNVSYQDLRTSASTGDSHTKIGTATLRAAF